MTILICSFIFIIFLLLVLFSKTLEKEKMKVWDLSYRKGFNDGQRHEYKRMIYCIEQGHSLEQIKTISKEIMVD